MKNTAFTFSAFFAFLALGIAANATAQTFDFLGLEAVPAGTDSIDALPYLGEQNDFSGGYAIGDTVADFHGSTHTWTTSCGSPFTPMKRTPSTSKTALQTAQTFQLRGPMVPTYNSTSHTQTA